LRVLTLQQGRRCCLVQGVLLQMVVTLLLEELVQLVSIMETLLLH
jgi:hypothetical protein